MIGKKLSPILDELSLTIMQHEELDGGKPEFDRDAILSAVHIFASVAGERMFEKNQKDNIGMDMSIQRSHEFGKELRELILKYTDIDTIKLSQQKYGKDIGSNTNL